MATTSTAPYIGNQDFRGYLNYLSQNSNDPNAGAALKYVGNDGQLSQKGLSTSSGDPLQFYVNQQYQAYNGFQPQQTAAAPTATAPTAAAPVVDPQIDQYYDSLQGNVQSQVDRLNPQLDVGNQNILDAYNTSYNTLLGQKGVTDRNYQTSKDQGLQDYVSGAGDIQAATGQQVNSLQRLLGAHGFGSSSASRVAAPYAAGLVGSQQTRGLQNTYDRNSQALDTNYGDYTNQYNTAVGDLGHQRDVQKNQLQSQIDTTRSSLLAQLAGIAQQRAQAKPGATYGDITAAASPYQQQIRDLGGQIDQLGRQYAQPVVQAAPPTYQAPKLDSYNVNRPDAPVVNNAPGAGSNLGSFLPLLLGQKDTKRIGGFQGLSV
jgi:hypothetical protein